MMLGSWYYLYIKGDFEYTSVHDVFTKYYKDKYSK